MRRFIGHMFQRGVVLIALLTLLFNLFGPLAWAQLTQCDVDALIEEHPYYDACTSGGTTNCNCTSLVGSDPKSKVVNYLFGKGLSAIAVAAIAGNLQQESDFSPTADNGLGFYGIAQWGGDRRTALQAYADSRGLPVSDLCLQLDYLWGELSGTIPNHNFKSTLDKVTNTSAFIPAYPNDAPSPDPNDAVYIIVHEYEGAVAPPGHEHDTTGRYKYGVQDYDPRLKFANEIFSQYGSGGTGPGPSPSCGGGGSVGGCKDPYRDVPNLISKRVDQGNDYSGDGPVHPACAGIVTYYNTNDTGWPGHNAISYKITEQQAGSAIGLTIFVAENCPLNSDLHAGSQVTTDTVLCTMHSVDP